MIAPNPQQMQSIKDKLNTFNFLRFMGFHTGNETEGFSGCPQTNNLAKFQCRAPVNHLIVHERSLIAGIR